MATIMAIDYASILYIISGIKVTLLYALVSVTCGIIVAVLLSFCRFSRFKVLQLFSSFYVSIFRGTPLLVQLSLVYFGVPSLLGFKISAFASGVIAFSLNSGAYISEVIRSGILSIDKGQFEAARTLGIPHNLMMRDIVFPQAFRNILPALVNELVDMLKESALVSVIGEADLMRRAQIVASQQYTYFGPLLVAALCYYIMVISFSFAAKYLEKKLHDRH